MLPRRVLKCGMIQNQTIGWYDLGIKCTLWSGIISLSARRDHIQWLSELEYAMYRTGLRT